jgi:putative oxidoreductase
MSSRSRSETSPDAPAKDQTSRTLRTYVFLLARVVVMFPLLISGLSKIVSYGSTADRMESAGVSGELLPVVIAAEVLGAYAILLGWKTRIVAPLLAMFTLATAAALQFRHDEQLQTIMLLKNLFVVGVLLVLTATGAGPLSLDGRKTR